MKIEVKGFEVYLGADSLFPKDEIKPQIDKKLLKQITTDRASIMLIRNFKKSIHKK